MGYGGEKATPGAMYVDAIIERHARRILSEGKLRDLGKLAAHLDLHLVSWLAKEKKRKGLMVTDFVGGLKMIHSEFEWPYPEFSGSSASSSAGSSTQGPHHSRTPSSGRTDLIMYMLCFGTKSTMYILFIYTDSMKLPSPETTSPLKPQNTDRQPCQGIGQRKLKVGGGDSGYNSTPGNNGYHLANNGDSAVEARLEPHSSAAPGIIKAESCFFYSNMLITNLLQPVSDDTISVLSEESVLMDQSPIQPSDFPPVYGISDATKISVLSSSKTGIQLRFLQQIMWEAGKIQLLNIRALLRAFSNVLQTKLLI